MDSQAHLEPMDDETSLEPSLGGDELVTALAEARQEGKEAREQLLRVLADNDNLQKRLARRHERQLEAARDQLIAGFLPVWDDLERALATTATDDALRRGVELTLEQFRDALARLGVTVVEVTAGCPFDPEEHEALAQHDHAELPAGAVAAVLKSGFRRGDRLIRPAQVTVVSRRDETGGNDD